MDANEEKVTPLQAFPHSKFGIAAFIIGLISLCILVSYLGLVFIGIQSHTSIFIASVMPTVMGFIYAVFVMGSVLTLISFILGLVALFQKNQKKLFAVLAIVQLLFEVCLLLVLSLYMVVLLTGAGA